MRINQTEIRPQMQIKNYLNFEQIEIIWDI